MHAVKFAAFAVIAFIVAGCDSDTEWTARKDGESFEAGLTAGEGKRLVSADHVEIDGMQMYPGADVTGVYVSSSRNDGDSQVRIDFHTEDEMIDVRRYFAERLENQDASMNETSENELSGETGEGARIKITLDASEGGTRGRLTVRRS